MKFKKSLIIAGLNCITVFGAFAADGQTLFKKNCVMCHGEDGKGQTPVGKALKARNFLTDAFKQGDSREAIAKTIKNGVPGTGMAGFATFSDEERLKMADFVLSLRGVSAPTQAAAPVKKAAPTPKPVAKAAPVKKAVQEVAKKVAQVTKAVAPAPVKKAAPAPKPVAKAAPAKPAAASEDFTKAKAIYKQLCASCHGPKGLANTPTGMALKARNLAKDPYKQGNSIDKILYTIENGLAGTAMAPFKTQIPSAEDRMQLAKYIKSVIGTDGFKEEKEKPPEGNFGTKKVSISHAMDLVAERPRHAFPIDFNDGSEGFKVYKENCASCHGNNGEGGISEKMISAAPFRRVKTEALLGHKGSWTSSKAAFTKLVTEGLSGTLMPGNGLMTKKQIDDLYTFILKSTEKAKK